MRCPRSILKKRASICVIVLTSFLTLWLQINILIYRSNIFPADSSSAINTWAINNGTIENVSVKQILSLLYKISKRVLDNTRGTLKLELPATQTNTTIRKTSPTEKHQKETQLINVHTYLPHLRGASGYMIPAVKVSQNRTGVKLVIGIPTVKRDKDGYLISSLNSILSNLSPQNALDCLVIVFIAEPWNSSTVNNITETLLKMYPTEIASGLMDIIAPKPDFYPNLDDLPLTLDDSKERVKWRTKQNLDFIYLMLHAYQRGQYYIQLEDDVITQPYFFEQIVKSINEQNNYWLVLKFSSLGFIGKLFHSADLPFIAEFLLMFHGDKPGDWLLDDILSTKVCGKDKSANECKALINKISISIRPSLFQHIGYHSSLRGKVQPLKDRNFLVLNEQQKISSKTNSNPKLSSIKTTIENYENYYIESAYVGTNIFWGKTPKVNDVIDFIYKPAIKIARYKFVTGTNTNPTDIFPIDTTIEISVENGTTIQNDTSLLQSPQFQIVGHFNQQGIAEGNLPADMAKVETLRIHINSNMTSWIIISDISITKG